MDINKPQPERFKVYNVLPGGKSFTINGSKFVFKLDRHNGWKDQYGHYYNSNGEPEMEPQDADLTPEQVSVNSDSGEDQYDKLYGGGNNFDAEDSDEEQHPKFLLKIAKNIEILAPYPLKKNVRVYFENMPYKMIPEQVFEIYSKRISGLLNIIFDLNEKKQRNGNGHFIMEDANAAEKLIKLQGEKIVERQLFFKVERLEELLMDPIKQADLTPVWKKPKRQYFNSQLSSQKEELVVKKIEEPEIILKQQKKISKTYTVKEVKKEDKKQSVTRKESEKKELSQFRTYKLNFQVFDTKTKFVNWMADLPAVRDVDYKNIKKEQKDGKVVVKIDVRRNIAESAKGRQFQGKEVIFTPIH